MPEIAISGNVPPDDGGTAVRVGTRYTHREAGMDAGLRVDLASKERVDALATRPRAAGLKIAIVHDWLTGMRGGEKCLEVLCRAFPTAELFTLIHKPGALSPPIEAMTIRTSPLQRVPGVLEHYRKLLPLMPLAARSWKPEGVDLVVSLSHCVAKSVQVPEGVPHVCYCFTPMRYAWQSGAYLAAWSGKPLRRAAAKMLLGRMRAWDQRTAAGVSHFVAISETVRGRIARFYGRDSVVIPPPVDTGFHTPDPNVTRDGELLCVSALVPYKRIDQAVTACSIMGRKLTVIGEGTEMIRLRRQAGPTVRFLGWQPDDVIREHYRRCQALLFPGEEDFGIVPIEALACGAPVIAYGGGGVAETVDNTVGRIYDAPTAEGLIEAIEEWEASGRPFDADAARRKAEAFALPLFQERLLGFLDDAVNRRRADRVPPRRTWGFERRGNIGELPNNSFAPGRLLP